jgi:hypothetical protein
VLSGATSERDADSGRDRQGHHQDEHTGHVGLQVS